MPRVRVTSSASFQQYQALAQRLRSADRELKRDLRQRIREAGDPALRAVRAAAMGIRMSSPGGGAIASGSTGLRGRIAGATKLGILASGVRFTVNERQVDPRYGETLVAGSEGTTWRHPIFGRRKGRWVEQTGSPWFYPTLQAEGPAFRRAVEKAVQDTLDKIGG